MKYITNMVKGETSYDVLYGMVKVAGKTAPFIRDLLVAKDHETIVAVWAQLESEDDKKALAVLRATVSRESKKLYGHGLTVKDGALVAVASRKRTESNEEPELVALAQYIIANANDDDVKNITAVLANFVASLKAKEVK